MAANRWHFTRPACQIQTRTFLIFAGRWRGCCRRMVSAPIGAAPPGAGLGPDDGEKVSELVEETGAGLGALGDRASSLFGLERAAARVGGRRVRASSLHCLQS